MATGIIKSVPVYNQLWSKLDIPTTATSYDCDWQDYKLLFITATFYTNRLCTVVIPSAYFASTSPGSRPLLSVYDGLQFEIYQNGSGKIYAKASTTNSAYGILIEGLT